MMAEPRHPRQVIGLLAGRWTLDILAQRADGGRRYQDIHDRLAGIAHQVLTSTLRRAERDGLIARPVDPGRVNAVVAAARARWVGAGLLDSDGSLTASGREQLDRCRTMVSEMTQALTAGIDPAAVEARIDTLDIVRTRAEQLLAG